MTAESSPELTALNCSIGYASWQAGLADASSRGWRRVELWWPFATPEPSAAEIADLTSTLRSHGQQLVAMNLWAGDMPAGERGILHREPLSTAHLSAVASISDATSLPRCNLVVGRSGPRLTDAQVERFAEASAWLSERCDVTVMAEPLSGMEDYPIRSIGDARVLLDAAPQAGLLLDIYHLAANHVADHATHHAANHAAHHPETPAVGALATPEGQEEFWKLVASDIDELVEGPEHVQVADLPGRGAPGTGTLPLGRWVEDLRRRGYRGDIVGEYLPESQ